jgi:hypothetical protein
MQDIVPPGQKRDATSRLGTLAMGCVAAYAAACAVLAVLLTVYGQTGLALAALHGLGVLAAVLAGVWIGARRLSCCCKDHNGASREQTRAEDNLIGPETGRPRNKMQLESLDGSGGEDSPSIPTQ